MVHYESTDRTESLMRLCPDLFTHKTALYVGASHGRQDYTRELHAGGARITVIEAFKPNTEFLKANCPWIDEVILGDVRTVEIPQKYDVVMWWHGPEHVPLADIRPTIEKLEAVTQIVTVTGCPWGNVVQGEVYGNVFEIHATSPR